MTGKSKQTTVLQLAGLLQNNNNGGLAILMNARPSGAIKPFKFDSNWYQLQRNIPGMANFNDKLIGNTTRMLVSNGMWNNKLLVIGDGPFGTNSNAPNDCALRGGKYSDLQGGIRAVSIVSGSVLQQNRRGIKLNGTIPSTFCSIIVGNNPNETRSIATNEDNKKIILVVQHIYHKLIA